MPDFRGGDQPPAEWDDLVPVEPGDAAAEGAVRPLVIGVVGDSGSGKTIFATALATVLGRDRVAELRLDDYHRFTREERAERGLTAVNPVVHNLALMKEHLELLRCGRPISHRTYRHEDGTFGPLRTVELREIVVARGLLGLPTDEFRDLYDLSVFLRPEPELLFRWKLRRDVHFRGYTEPEVLRNIADQLLDAKEFVLPQADRADVVVEYSLPDPEAPDDDIVTTLRARRRAGEIVASNGLFADLPVERAEEAGDVIVRIPPGVPESAVEDWADARIGRCERSAAGVCHDETGGPVRRGTLALAELIVAYVGREMAVDR